MADVPQAGTRPLVNDLGDGTHIPVYVVADTVTVTTSSAAYDVPVYFVGAPTADQVMLRFVASRAFSLASGLSGSAASAVTAATASTVLVVKKNGSNIGTITFAISGTTGTFAGAGGSFAAGDVLTVVGPHVPDATLANVSITLAGTLAP